MLERLGVGRVGCWKGSVLKGWGVGRVGMLEGLRG